MSQSRPFAELLTDYMGRTGIGDAELARRINVNRLTLIRWREGVTERPRHRDDVDRCADVLRLTQEERDEFLLAAGFQPDNPPAAQRDPLPPASPLDSLESGKPELGTQPDAEGTQEAHFPAPPPRTPLTERVSGSANRGLKIGIVLVVVGFLAVGFAVVTNNRDLGGLDPEATPGSPVDTSRATDAPAAANATVSDPAVTSISAALARDGESLILLAPFANYTGGGQGYNVSGRLQERIESEFSRSGLPQIRTAVWPQTILSESEALRATETSGALLTIWGEYDSGRVLARFMTTPSYSGTSAQRAVDIASSPSQLPTTINVNLTGAVRYVALVTSGRVYLDQGDYDRAKAVLARAADPPPIDPAALADVRYLLGAAYLDGQFYDYDESITMFSLVLEEQPRSVESLNGRAVAYMRRARDGDVERSLSDLTRAESIQPDRAETYLNLGVAYMTRAGDNDPNRALSAFRVAISLDPEFAAAYANRAGAYIARGQSSDLELAFADLDRALELNPDLYFAYVNRGLGYVARAAADDLEKAIAEYTLAIDLSPTSPDAYYHRGLAYSARGDLPESAADLERAAELDRHNVAYTISACQQLSVMGDPASALHYCDAAVQGGGGGPALFARAVAYAILGRPDDAETDLEGYVAWANAAPEQSCRAAYLEAASLLEAPIATARGDVATWDLLDFRPRPVIPARPAC